MKGAFLVNTSRSGSTMMSTILRQHPDVLSLSELMTMQGSRALLPGRIDGDTFWRQLAKPTPVMRQLANPHSAPNEFLYHTVPGGRFDPFDCPPILAVTLPHLFQNPDAIFDHLAQVVPRFGKQTRADHCRALIETLAAQTGQQHWVERSGGTLIATAALAERFPEAKFVLILRDGRDVALSMQNYLPAHFLIWFWKTAKRMGIDVFKPGAHIGSTRWIAMAERLSGSILPMKRILQTRPSIEDAAACWSAMIHSGIGQFQALPQNRRIVMRYEEITKTPRPQLSRLAQFLELPEHEAWLRTGAGIPRVSQPRYMSLPMHDQQKLDELTAAGRQISNRVA